MKPESQQSLLLEIQRLVAAIHANGVSITALEDAVAAITPTPAPFAGLGSGDGIVGDTGGSPTGTFYRDDAVWATPTGLQVSNTPAGNIAATTVQAALNELDTEKVDTGDSRLSDSRAPNGSASGDLTGTYPGPTITTDAVTYAKMQNVSAASKLLGRGSAGGSGDPEEITLGTNLSMSGTTLNATGGGLTPTETNLNLGASPGWDGVVNVVDAGATGAETVVVLGAGPSADATEFDSWQWDTLELVGRSKAGSIDFYWRSDPGPLSGTRYISYALV